jgi:hypothetical protein
MLTLGYLLLLALIFFCIRDNFSPITEKPHLKCLYHKQTVACPITRRLDQYPDGSVIGSTTSSRTHSTLLSASFHSFRMAALEVEADSIGQILPVTSFFFFFFFGSTGD